MSDDAALRAYLLKHPGGVPRASPARRASTSSAPIPIPPLEDLLGSDSDDPEDVGHLPASTKPTSEVPPAPDSASTSLPLLASGTSTVDELLESSTLAFLVSTALDLATYALISLAAYLSLRLLALVLPYLFSFLHFTLRHLESLTRLIIRLGRFLALLTSALLALGLSALALAYLWFRWGEKALDGRAPRARRVFLALAALGIVARYAPWWGKWVVAAAMAGAGWRELEPEMRRDLRKMVLHPRMFWGEVREGYRMQVEMLEREEREKAAGVDGGGGEDGRSKVA